MIGLNRQLAACAVSMLLVSPVGAEPAHPDAQFQQAFSHIQGSETGRFVSDQGHLFFNIRQPTITGDANVLGNQSWQSEFTGINRDVVNLMSASAEALGASSPSDLKWVETRQSQHASHYRFSLMHKGLPVRGADYRVHVSNNGGISSYNGQRPEGLEMLELYTRNYGGAGELKAALIDQSSAFALAKLAIKDQAYNGNVDGFQVLHSSLELSVVPPHARYTFDLSQPRGMQRFFVEIDAATGDVIFVQDRIRAHSNAIQRGGLR